MTENTSESSLVEAGNTSSDLALADWETQDSIVAEGAKQFVKVGLALTEIRQKHLYKQGGFETFGDYVKARIDMSEQQTLKIRNAAQFVDEFEKEGVSVLPSTESQIRVLSKFKKEKYKESRRKIWEAAVKEATEKKIPVTAKMVESHARRLHDDRFKPTENAVKKANERVGKLRSILELLENAGNSDLAEFFKKEHKDVSDS